MKYDPKVIGIAGILFFGATGIFAVKKLFDKKPGLIIDQNCITDQSSGVSLGLIRWSDITEIKVEQIMSTRLLLIHVCDAGQYLNNVNRTKRRMLQANMKMYGTPIAISSVALKCNFTELETWIRSGLNSVR